jgi:hypothetical protein
MARTIEIGTLLIKEGTPLPETLCLVDGHRTEVVG